MVINIDYIKTKPLHDLLVYREALVVLIDKYEKMVVPRFSRAEQFDRLDPKEIENKAKLSKLQGCLATLMLIIEEKTLQELSGDDALKTNNSAELKTNKKRKK